MIISQKPAYESRFYENNSFDAVHRICDLSRLPLSLHLRVLASLIKCMRWKSIDLIRYIDFYQARTRLQRGSVHHFGKKIHEINMVLQPIRRTRHEQWEHQERKFLHIISNMLFTKINVTRSDSLVRPRHFLSLPDLHVFEGDFSAYSGFHKHTFWPLRDSKLPLGMNESEWCQYHGYNRPHH